MSDHHHHGHGHGHDDHLEAHGSFKDYSIGLPLFELDLFPYIWLDK